MTYVLLLILATFLFGAMIFAALALPNLRNILFNRGSLFNQQSETVTCPKCKTSFKRAPGDAQTCPNCYHTF